jgi:chromosome segregation ATPase
LDEREAAFLAQPVATRQPTLPMTPDGKVNVRAVAQAIDLMPTQEKYLFEREELTTLINCIAEGQGVLTIGARVNPTDADKQIKQKIIQHAKNAQQATQAATAAVAAQQELLDRIRSLSADLEAAKAEVLRLRTRLQAVEAGVWVTAQ